uniref:Reverse transcriptase domain-containing protein n=1 Tax=Strongyloides venezuelensis TaxID=75913 RepID=A0A0K0FBR1_STRVS
MKCSLVKDQLKNYHTISGIPIDNNLLSDPFHDLNLGVLSNVFFGTTQIVQIITDLTPLQIYKSIINKCILMKKYGYINSVINENFFALQKTQDTLSKKGRYLLNAANIRFKNILSRTNSRINPCFTIVKKITWNNFINRHRKVHNELIVENNNWIYDQSVMDCDENEQLEDSMEEKIKE